MTPRIGLLVLVAVLTVTIDGPKPTECARILAMQPLPAKSHSLVFTALTKELARRGHELVVVSAYPLSKPIANYTDIDTMPALKELHKKTVGETLYDMANFKLYQIPLMMWGLGLDTTELVLKMPEVRELLDDVQGFDLVIVEAFMNEAMYGFAEYFKAPLVLICPFGGWHWLNLNQGNPAPSSYVPNPLMPFSDNMSFPERFINMVFPILWDVGHQLYYMPRQEELRRELFGEKRPSVWELERAVSLTLLNNHFSLNYPRPLVPAMVEVGGLHVSQKTNKLPTDIQKFLDEAKDGAIYFSMGSNLRSDMMPVERRQAFMDAFSELPQRVLWKWESNSLPGQPANVKLGKWLPQQDILAHPNVRLFITHGGLLSAQEAAFHGVPLVGIPVFGDQALNMRKAELGGFGVMVELKNVTKESMLWAVGKALQPSFLNEARRRSVVNRDQPESPLERAVFWTEYVLRHKGAPHLRSAALGLAWYQLCLLDVAAAVLAALLLLVLALRCALRLCCGGAKKPLNNSQEKKKQ